MFDLPTWALVIVQIFIVLGSGWYGWQTHLVKAARDQNITINTTVEWMIAKGYAVGGLNEKGEMELHVLDVIKRPTDKDKDNEND